MGHRLRRARAVRSLIAILLLASFVVLSSSCDDGGGGTSQSVARQWNEQALAAIRRDAARPPVNARNLFHLSVAMYDAWAAYDTTADGYVTTTKVTADEAVADCLARGRGSSRCSPEQSIAWARDEAVTWAAFTLLDHRYTSARGATESRTAFRTLLSRLGYDALVPPAAGTPGALGVDVANAVVAAFVGDGSNETNNYVDTTGYVPDNPAWPVTMPGISVIDPNRWQPLSFDRFVDQNGQVTEAFTQSFVGSNWLKVQAFAMTRADSTQPYIDPGAPPQLDGNCDDVVRDDLVEVVRFNSEVDTTDPIRIDVSPGAMGNNTLGTNDGSGHPVNPATGQPYPSEVVLRADFARIIAEMWADGPRSETPPGHWNLIANQVSDHPEHVRRIAGQGAVVDRLEWDVKVYFAMNGALHDAAVAAWGLKRFYDGGRPFSMIRYMASLGQCSDPAAPGFNPMGIRLVPGLIEVITSETTAPGQRHAALAGHEGEIALRGWQGQPSDPTSQLLGVDWILGIAWHPYQRNDFITPPFPGYISGHSTFSRAAAEVLAAITGDEFFPGGYAEFVAKKNEYLIHEQGPTQTVRLRWATYFDAADQAGISRLYGGIHPRTDDLTGRRVGSTVGKGAWALARTYFDGTVRP